MIADILSRLRRGQTIERYPARLRAKDGTIGHVQITSSAKIVEGGLVHPRCLTVDVTDAMRAEDWHRQLLDALPATFYATDLEGPSPTSTRLRSSWRGVAPSWARTNGAYRGGCINGTARLCPSMNAHGYCAQRAAFD